MWLERAKIIILDIIIGDNNEKRYPNSFWAVISGAILAHPTFSKGLTN